jgi:two-component system, sensor histidine kinase and response regulator
MEKEYLDNLFKIDVQTTRPGTKKEKGTGLGLLICSEFAKLHSGEIKVVSEVGKGTQFFIHLPK